MRQEIPFTNKFGQTINPGDKVVWTTLRWKFVEQGTGTYVGLYNGKVQVRVPEQKILITWKHPDGMISKSWCAGAKVNERIIMWFDRIATLQLNRIVKFVE